jgi:hypothetical protein
VRVRRYQKGFEPLMPGFVYVDYNDVEGLKRTVRRINTLGKLRGLVPGKGRKGEGVAVCVCVCVLYVCCTCVCVSWRGKPEAAGGRAFGGLARSRRGTCVCVSHVSALDRGVRWPACLTCACTARAWRQAWRAS